MLSLPPRARIFLAMQPTDMRKQMNGLAILVREGLGRNPRSGELFVFRSKRGDMARVLFYDQQGYCLLSKRFDRGTFCWPKGCGKETSIEMNAEQLAKFLMGMEIVNQYCKTPKRT